MKKPEDKRKAESRKRKASTGVISPRPEIKNDSAIEYPAPEIKNKPEIENPTSEITMEVHHHPEVEKKGFKEYLLEGLMIFLAVTMGFFAESYREHFSDRAKENEFMRSMIKDLKTDTAEINFSVKNFNSIFLRADTILTSLKSNKPDAATIYRSISHHFWTYSGYSYNNRTVQQLKNAGNFRLIRDNVVADSILKYDNYQNSLVLTQYVDLKNTMMAYKDIEARVIHYKELKQTAGSSLKPLNSTDFNITNTPVFITTDKELLSLYYNRLFIHEVLGHTFITSMKKSGISAANLIMLIKKEYHLEDE